MMALKILLASCLTVAGSACLSGNSTGPREPCVPELTSTAAVTNEVGDTVGYADYGICVDTIPYLIPHIIREGATW